MGERGLNELECFIKRIGGVVCSWECDGLFVANLDIDFKDENAGREWRDKVLEQIRARTNIPVTIKWSLQMDDILVELREKFPGEDWLEQEVESIMDQEALIAEVLRLESKSNLHSLYARIVALEPQAFEEHPYTCSAVMEISRKRSIPTLVRIFAGMGHRGCQGAAARYDKRLLD